MSKRDKIDDVAEDILRILDENPDPPETQARQAIQRAVDAGDCGLRQQHLKEAQSHIARVDARRNPALVRRLQADVLAVQGRGGDTAVAHVTPGEMVIPARMQTPEFMNALFALARTKGIDPRSLFVGSGRNNINPRTGMMEFADDDASLDETRSSHAAIDPSDDIPSITVTTQPLTGVMPNDVDALARMMISESTTETTPGLYQALGSVALNRVGNRNVPNSQTLQDVIRNRGQFNGYGGNNWTNAHTMESYPRALEVANGLLSGSLKDNTGGAVTFYSKHQETDSPPGDFARREQAPVGTWRRLEPTASFSPFTFLNQPWG